MNNERRREGASASGLKVPAIKDGDNLIEIILEILKYRVIRDKDIIGITESVLAIAQGNLVKQEHIQEYISKMYGKELVILNPIQSRNRFLEILKAIASTPTLEKITIVFTYPSDEVGNHFVSKEKFWELGIESSTAMTAEEFCEKVGKVEHPITGINYIELYKEACNGKANIVLCNDFSKVPYLYGKDILVCSIHEKDMVKRILMKNGAETVFDLADIMNKPIGESGYSPKYGLYGSNKMANGKLKLMPRDSQKFVEELQKAIHEETGKFVEVLVFGDGAFKDPATKIWELADPTTTLGATSGLQGMPIEVKFKYIADQNKDKTPEEIREIVKKEKEKRQEDLKKTADNALGTTPRKITDLLSSLFDLLVGSGDKGTPIVHMTGYLD